jgi:hypothetical protein
MTRLERTEMFQLGLKPFIDTEIIWIWIDTVGPEIIPLGRKGNGCDGSRFILVRK